MNAKRSSAPRQLHHAAELSGPHSDRSWDPYTGIRLLQVRDTLGALADRCAALKIDGAALHVSRLLRRESRGLAVKRITMYSPNWVKSQNRMSSTSNQVRCLAVTIHKFLFCHQATLLDWLALISGNFKAVKQQLNRVMHQSASDTTAGGGGTLA